MFKQLAAVLASLTITGATPAYGGGAQAPFRLSSKISRKLQNATGINRITGIVASQALTLILKSRLKGKVKAKVRTYSLTDLISGKIKAIDITIDGARYSGVPLGTVHVMTLNPIHIRYLKSRTEKPGLRQPVLIGIEGSISEGEVSQALSSGYVATKIRGLNLDLPGLGAQQLQLIEPRVAFEHGKFKIDSCLVTNGARPETGVKLTLLGKPSLENDCIFLKDLQVVCDEIENPQEFARFTAELFNPIVNFRRMDRVQHAFRLLTLDMKDRTLLYKGNLILAPKPRLPALANGTAAVKAPGH